MYCFSHFRHIVGDMEICLSVLLQDLPTIAEKNMRLLPPAKSNPMSTGIKYGQQEAQTSFIYDIAVLVEMGNAKNNLIGVSETFELCV